MSKRLWLALVTAMTCYAFTLGTAHAGPLCSAITPEVSVASFMSCVSTGQDSFAKVQAALNDALNPDLTLLVSGSFCSAGGCGGSEFSADSPANNFDFTQINGHTFTFNSLPTGTQFVTIKQANGFEVFRVPSPGMPFTVTHHITQPGFSHFSTFVTQVVPTPELSSTLLLGLSLAGVGMAWSSLRSRHEV